MWVTAAAAVAVGGALGSVARFWMTSWFLNAAPNWFPFGTLVINALGAFAIGIAGAVLLGNPDLSPALRFGVVAGLLGGFTTVSGFALETWVLVERGAWGVALGYVVATVVIALAMTGLGLWLARQFWSGG